MTTTATLWRRHAAPSTLVSALVLVLLAIACLFARWVAPHDPFDPATVDLMDALTPPVFSAEGRATFPLGTDEQGRDVLSSVIYGTRLSLLIGLASVALAAVLGVTLGLAAGYHGGWLDRLLMRVADVQLSFPPILVAILIDGVARIVLPAEQHDRTAIAVLVVAIGLSNWVQYARAVRGATLVERHKEYVLAARVIGVHPAAILLRHILPNVLGPVYVLATLGLALAILTEATLSFLGIGLPPTQPSLGTLIRVGNDFLFSGQWWVVAFPALTLVAMVLAVNTLGDWLRDVLDPKLQ